ncbi:MAG: hypothetical protein QM503_09235 [Bacteroidota bacterium]
MVNNINAQELSSADEGSVSYITSQNIYVKFKSTKHINIGDTLFVMDNDKRVPALVVTNTSSISCVCVPISTIKLEVNRKLFAKQRKIVESKPEANQKKELVAVPVVVASIKDTVDDGERKPSQAIRGRLSVASYSNFSNTDGGNSQRMRYTFSMNAKNIGNSKISTDTYISFVHDNNNWDEIKSNIFNGLKIYSLAVIYEPTETMTFLLGRKINPRISNIGAIDGIQFEKKFKSFSVGGFAGSRPNYMDYSVDFTLPQFGAYLAHSYNGKKGNMESTFAFVEQKNDWKTDRRFAYFQHSNSLVNKLYLFTSAELELYQKIDGVEKSTFNLNNLYLMLRYKVIRQLSFSVSYRSQARMIYYETYKSYVDQLLEQATVEGYRFQVNYRTNKKISMGARVSYRAAKQDPKPTKTLYGYVAFSRIPWIDASATVSVTLLETSYLSGNIYSLGITRDIIPGKLQGRIGYRYVDYTFVNYDASLVQHVGDANITWRMMRKLSLSMNYEGIFESVNNYSRLYINLIKRL